MDRQAALLLVVEHSDEFEAHAEGFEVLAQQTAGAQQTSEVHAGMSRYLDEFGLSFAAFDFGVTADGRWLLYEANPNGQWLWIAEKAGLPIAASIADLLTAGTAG